MCYLPVVDKLFIVHIKKNIESSIPFKAPVIELSSLGEDECVIGLLSWQNNLFNR